MIWQWKTWCLGSWTDLLSPCSHPSSLNGNVWFVGWRSPAKADVSPIFGEKVVYTTASHALIHLTAVLPAERQLLSDCGDFRNRVCHAMAIRTAKSNSDVGLLVLQTLFFFLWHQASGRPMTGRCQYWYCRLPLWSGPEECIELTVKTEWVYQYEYCSGAVPVNSDPNPSTVATMLFRTSFPAKQVSCASPTLTTGEHRHVSLLVITAVFVKCMEKLWDNVQRPILSTLPRTIWELRRRFSLFRNRRSV